MLLIMFSNQEITIMLLCFIGRNGSMILIVGFCFKLSLGTVANGFHRY